MQKNHSKNLSKRSLSRRIALQALYQWEISRAPFANILAEFLADLNEQDCDIDYLKILVKGTIENADDLDQLIQPHLDRELKALSPVELSALRIGVFELQHRLEVPYKVVINEAIELTKQFGTEEGYKYINGVLDKVATIIRKDEQ